MLAGKKDLILRELEEGTGAAMSAAVDSSGLRSGLRIWFADLDERHGPVAELRPYGLKGHSVTLSFGTFSGEIINQIRRASSEDVQLARALIASIRPDIEVQISGQARPDWTVTAGSFRMTARIRDQDLPHEDVAITAICRDVIVPMMAAMAELIGYDIIEDEPADETPAFEGAFNPSFSAASEIRATGSCAFVSMGSAAWSASWSRGWPTAWQGALSRSIISSPLPCLPNLALMTRVPIWYRFVHRATERFIHGAPYPLASRN
jgi:hypothetical protein